MKMQPQSPSVTKILERPILWLFCVWFISLFIWHIALRKRGGGEWALTAVPLARMRNFHLHMKELVAEDRKIPSPLIYEPITRLMKLGMGGEFPSFEARQDPSDGRWEIWYYPQRSHRYRYNWFVRWLFLDFQRITTYAYLLSVDGKLYGGLYSAADHIDIDAARKMIDNGALELWDDWADEDDRADE